MGISLPKPDGCGEALTRSEEQAFTTATESSE